MKKEPTNGDSSGGMYYTCSYVPQEIILAAGMTPVRLIPEPRPSEADAYHEHLRQRLPIATRQRKAGDMLATILTDTSMRAYANGDGGWELESEVPINPAIRCQILLHINGEGR